MIEIITNRLSISSCLSCGGKLIQTSSKTICTECKEELNDVQLLSRYLDISEKQAVPVLKNLDFGNLDINKHQIVNKNGAINTAPLTYNFPTMSEVPEEGVIYLTDSPDYHQHANTVFLSCGFNPTWMNYFKGRHVVILIHEDRRNLIRFSKLLATVTDNCHIGRWGGNPQEDVEKCTPLSRPKTIDELDNPSTLKGLLDSFHWVMTAAGAQYRTTPRRPLHEVASSVVDWLTNNGAKFFWDVQEDIGHMMYKGNTYRLCRNDPGFLSLLKDEGGIFKTTNEGSTIIEALVNTKNIAKKIEVKPWLENKGTEIKLKQKENEIIIIPNDIKVVSSGSVEAYTESTSFKAIEIIPTDKWGAVEKLFTHIGRFFSVPPEARDLIITWMMTILIKDLASIRPGIRLYGKASSGKSTILQLIYWFFYGGEDPKLPTYTVPGLWRTASTEPLVLIDNENVKDIDESLRTFLDLAATGGRRIMGVGGSASATATKQQEAHCSVMVSGLDNFLERDVLTRYLEIEASRDFQTDYYQHEDKGKILSYRNEIWNGLLQLFAEDILPNISDFLTRKEVKRVKGMLGEKERISDYFLLMIFIGRLLQSKGLIDYKNIELSWVEYLLKKSFESQLLSSTSLEWWKILRMVLNDGNFFLDEGKVEFLRDPGGNITGIQSSREKIISMMRESAKVTSGRLPWNSYKDMLMSMKEEEATWKKTGWNFKENEGRLRVDWR